LKTTTISTTTAAVDRDGKIIDRQEVNLHSLNFRKIFDNLTARHGVSLFQDGDTTNYIDVGENGLNFTIDVNDFVYLSNYNGDSVEKDAPNSDIRKLIEKTSFFDLTPLYKRFVICLEYSFEMELDRLMLFLKIENIEFNENKTLSIQCKIYTMKNERDEDIIGFYGATSSPISSVDFSSEDFTYDEPKWLHIIPDYYDRSPEGETFRKKKSGVFLNNLYDKFISTIGNEELKKYNAFNTYLDIAVKAEKSNKAYAIQYYGKELALGKQESLLEKISILATTTIPGFFKNKIKPIEEGALELMAGITNRGLNLVNGTRSKITKIVTDINNDFYHINDKERMTALDPYTNRNIMEGLINQTPHDVAVRDVFVSNAEGEIYSEPGKEFIQTPLNESDNSEERNDNNPNKPTIIPKINDPTDTMRMFTNQTPAYNFDNNSNIKKEFPEEFTKSNEIIETVTGPPNKNMPNNIKDNIEKRKIDITSSNNERKFDIIDTVQTEYEKRLHGLDKRKETLKVIKEEQRKEEEKRIETEERIKALQEERKAIEEKHRNALEQEKKLREEQERIRHEAHEKERKEKKEEDKINREKKKKERAERIKEERDKEERDKMIQQQEEKRKYNYLNNLQTVQTPDESMRRRRGNSSTNSYDPEKEPVTINRPNLNPEVLPDSIQQMNGRMYNDYMNNMSTIRAPPEYNIPSSITSSDSYKPDPQLTKLDLRGGHNFTKRFGGGGGRTFKKRQNF
jgi:hypothetical protein